MKIGVIGSGDKAKITYQVREQHARCCVSQLARCCLLVLCVAAAPALPATAYAQTAEVRTAYKIAAGPLGSALNQLAQASRLQIVYPPELVAGLTTRGLSGDYTPRQALEALLKGSGLVPKYVNANMVVIERGTTTPPAPVPPTVRKPAASAAAPERNVTELAEILVTGTRSLNTDIERTRDDVQPYVVFHRETIERSGAVSVDDFLKQRLPMNVQAASFNQSVRTEGNRSQVNLRGLGTNQTLILIDGRRTSNTVSRGGELLQSDLNGIPLAAIERIEVLPTTASGIYGGDATGGVINIILRRDYQGTEVKLTWDNTFDTDSAQPRLDVSTGFNLGENTNVMITASRAQGNVLLNRDRDFVEDYRRQAFANNPSLYLPPASPPLGFLPNLRSADGSDLVLDDGVPLGSNFTHVPAGYAGAGSDGGAAFMANAGTYEFGLANSSQFGGGRNALLNAPEITSANLTVRHEFAPKVEGFLELAASNNVGHFVFNNLPSEIFLPADAPNNPFQQDLQVQVPLPTQDFEFHTRNTDRRIVAGAIIKLPWDWLAETDYIWTRTSSRSLNAVELTPAGNMALADGTLDILRDPNVHPLDLSAYVLPESGVSGPFETTTRNPTLLLGGPVGTLPGGRPMLSLRLEHRDEQFAEATLNSPGFSQIYPAKSQAVSSGFAELRLPLFSSLNQRSGLRELELQLSVRHDRYQIEGSTGSISTPEDPISHVENELSSTNTTVGFRWRPIEDLVLRASYGTGFLPPSVIQLVPGSPFLDQESFFIDPRRGNTPTTGFQVFGGGNPDLRPEESKSISAGLILEPHSISGFRLSVDYTRIEKTDNITLIPGFQQGLLNNEGLFPGRVIRGQNLPGDPAGWAGPVTLMDLTLVNIASAEVEAYDVQLDYVRDTDWGSFNFFAVATWQTHYKTQLLNDQPIFENVGFRSTSNATPLKFKANAGVVWTRRSWTLGWSSRYFDSYRPYFASDVPFPDSIAESLLTQGAPRIDSQIYHDFTAQYQFGAGDGNRIGHLLDGVSIQFGIRNVLNKKPPRELDSYSPYGDPRLASYWLAIKKSFSN